MVLSVTLQQKMKIGHRKEAQKKLAEKMEAQLDALDDRKKEREKIVTENKFDLRDEINKL